MYALFKKIYSWLKYYDWRVIISVILLLSFGLAALYGIATGFDKPDFLNFKKQMVFAGIGIVAMLFVSLLDYGWVKQFANVLYAVGGLALLVVLIFGKTMRGTTGWLS